ncbi:hypothetical protein [Sphingobacterium zeae]|uniref:DUF3352 domain-containing protein n=1 Tax=Sphingobacterium zeae TaxID=1776859 RepID=A0ABU0U6I7_9SPHI|nr:hypothetical protein [Sphingobacterium zeae]MDQ1150544.1 hypothetical protein [Sphingobacterium zeae]
MIKKTIVWTIGIVILLMITVWGIYILRQHESYKSLVHKDSKALLTVSLDDILLNQFFNKWQLSQKEHLNFDKRLSKLQDNGIDIKANIFLFALEEQPKNFYAFFQLKDKQQFLYFLKEVIHVDPIEKGGASGISYAYDPTNKMAFVCRGNELLIGVGFDLDKKKEEMLQLIQSKGDMVTIKQFIADPSTLTGQSVRYSDLSTNNYIELTLKGDQVDIYGDFTSKNWNFPKEFLVRELESTKYIATSWVNIPTNQLKNKLKQAFEEFPMMTDSLITHLDGNYIDIEILKNKVTQTDTIINYAVDENFETVEEKTLYNTHVPEVRVTMRGDSNLNKFLPNKLFYQWFKKQDRGFSMLSTSRDVYRLSASYKHTDELSHVAIHLADWPNEFKITPILALKAIASDIILSLKVVNRDRMVLEGTLKDYSH